MKYEPDGRKHLTGNGNLHLHFVLSPNNGLDVAELVVEASLRYASRLDLSRTFLVTRFQSTPGYEMGGIFKR